MITIIEEKPKKLSGLTSLSISFKYNPKIVEIIKSSEKYIYNPETRSWEVPISSLAYLLDNLTYVDDITLKLIDDNTYELTDSDKNNYNIPEWFLHLDTLIKSDIS